MANENNFNLKKSINLSEIPIFVFDFWSTDDDNHRKRNFRENPYEPVPEPVNGMKIGDEIEITINQQQMRYIEGKIHWFGKHKYDQNIMVGVDVEDFYGDSDGCYNGFRYFQLPTKTGMFVNLNRCHPKNYHINTLVSNAQKASKEESKQFIEEDVSETVNEIIKPIVLNANSIKKFTGLKKGIQGNINSCYIDSVLFSMFASTPLFDQILLPNMDNVESNSVEQIRKIISTEIVYPLRKNGFVAASKIAQLRFALSDLFNNSSFINEEKDPEEFINTLLGNVFNYDVKFRLNSNQEMYCFQLFADKNEQWDFPTVQQLFEQSLITNKLKIAEIPQYIVLQMPRYGVEFKMYDYIFPSPTLDLSELIVNHPRKCCICGKSALKECIDCYKNFPYGISFCFKCYNKVHNDKCDHMSTFLKYDPIYNINENNAELDLLAVICIETSHYVSFTKMDLEKNTWAFFDSMSKREEGINGRNIPCIEPVNLFNYENGKLVKPDKKKMLENLMTKRLIRDVYYCIYQNTKIFV